MRHTNRPLAQSPVRLAYLSKLLATGIAAVALLAASSAQAQSANGPVGGKRHAELQERFRAADTNNDGKLTKEEAKAGMPMVYKQFDEIDAARSGAVSLADIAAFAKAKRGAR